MAASGSKDGPVFFDSSIGWPDSGGMEANDRAALRHATANHAARQQAETNREAHQRVEAAFQAARTTDQQAKAGIAAKSAEATDNLTLTPNTGRGQKRQGGIYDELKKVTPTQEVTNGNAIAGGASSTETSEAARAAYLRVKELGKESGQRLAAQERQGQGRARQQPTIERQAALDRYRAVAGRGTPEQADEAARRQMEGGKQREETRADRRPETAPLTRESREAAARTAYQHARGGTQTTSGESRDGGGQTTGLPGGRGGGGGGRGR